MNDNFKIDETVEYHFYSIREKDDTIYVTKDYTTALSAFRSRDYNVFEIHIVRYRSEWSEVEHKYKYEWHED